MLKRQVGSTNRVRGKPELAFHAVFALLDGGGSFLRMVPIFSETSRNPDMYLSVDPLKKHPEPLLPLHF